MAITQSVYNIFGGILRKFGGISDGMSCWGGSRPPDPPGKTGGAAVPLQKYVGKLIKFRKKIENRCIWAAKR